MADAGSTATSANDTPEERRLERPSDTAFWVVGIDGSDSALHALDWAHGQAVGRTDCLRLVTAWQAPITGAPVESWPATVAAVDRRELIQSAQLLVDEASRQVPPHDDLCVEPVVAHGGASAILLDAAEDAALLVVGTRGRGGFQRLLLGSTSTQCATHASGPIAVVPDAATVTEARDIVVAVDGSDNSIAALRWALQFAAPTARIEALSVWDSSPIAAGADVFFFPEATGLAEERFNHLVDAVERDDADGDADSSIGGRTIERSFITGQPRAVLAERSHTADVLVVGARGHGAIGAALMGSVSTWLLHRAVTTTVVVPAAS